MSIDTVPRPPLTDEQVVDQLIDHAPDPIMWRAVFASIATVVLVAVPVAVAWIVGVVARCVALIVAASAEAYAAGRGRRG